MALANGVRWAVSAYNQPSRLRRQKLQQREDITNLERFNRIVPATRDALDVGIVRVGQTAALLQGQHLGANLMTEKKPPPVSWCRHGAMKPSRNKGSSKLTLLIVSLSTSLLNWNKTMCVTPFVFPFVPATRWTRPGADEAKPTGSKKRNTVSRHAARTVFEVRKCVVFCVNVLVDLGRVWMWVCRARRDMRGFLSWPH
jgi:hypothetical protein